MKFQHAYAGRIIYLLTILLLPVLLLAIFSNGYRVYDYYFNPDSLYLASLYRGLFIDGFPLATFSLNPSILLIPDVILYFPVRALTGDVVIAAFIFTIIQHLLIFGFILLIYKKLFGKKYLFSAALANLLFMVFFLGAILSKDILFAAFSLVSTNHVGAFVMMLISLSLVLDFISRAGRRKLIWLFVIILLSVFSDRIFMIMITVPIIFVSGFKYFSERKSKWIWLPVIIVLASVAGFLLQNFVNGRFIHLAQVPGFFDLKGIIPAFTLMMNDLGNYFIAMDAHALIILLSVLSFVIQVVLVVRMIRHGNTDSLHFFYLAFSVIYIAAIFWLPVITGSYIHKSVLRYNISAFYLAMINIPVLAGILFNNQETVRSMLKWITASGFVILLSIAVTHLSRSGIRNFFDYYPDFVREADEIAGQEDLKCGVAQFWIARPITMFSKTGLEVYHSWDNFLPYLHVNSRLYFSGKGQVFNFAIISSFDDKTAYRKFLDNRGRLVKYGHTEVLILPPFRYKEPWLIPTFEKDTVEPLK